MRGYHVGRRKIHVHLLSVMEWISQPSKRVFYFYLQLILREKILCSLSHPDGWDLNRHGRLG